MENTEYKELLHSSVIHVPHQTQPIKEAVAQYFGGHVIAQMGNPGANAVRHSARDYIRFGPGWNRSEVTEILQSCSQCGASLSVERYVLNQPARHC